MANIKTTLETRARRKTRTRGKINGSASRPRLSVFRSNKRIFLQLIDDINMKTLVSSQDIGEGKGNKTQRAKEAGKKLAESALSKKITKAVFDKGSYLYHGRVKAAADGAREGGLKF